MANMTTSRVTGLKEARAALRKLPDRVQKRVMSGAVRAGATVIRSEVKRAAPVGGEPSKAAEMYGRLKDNLRVIKLKRNIPKGSAMYRVDTGNAFWGYMLEFGTVLMAARPWFRPAVDGGYAKAVNKIKERLAAGIEREATKLYKGRK